MSVSNSLYILYTLPTSSSLHLSFPSIFLSSNNLIPPFSLFFSSFSREYTSNSSMRNKGVYIECSSTISYPDLSPDLITIRINYKDIREGFNVEKKMIFSDQIHEFFPSMGPNFKLEFNNFWYKITGWLQHMGLDHVSHGDIIDEIFKSRFSLQNLKSLFVDVFFFMKDVYSFDPKSSLLHPRSSFQNEDGGCLKRICRR